MNIQSIQIAVEVRILLLQVILPLEWRNISPTYNLKMAVKISFVSLEQTDETTQ
jgi:hypothetical protein